MSSDWRTVATVARGKSAPSAATVQAMTRWNRAASESVALRASNSTP
jgi:hypothetical protein